jgi:hypothetical protein
MRKIEAEVVQELVDWYRAQAEPPTLGECMSKFELSRDSVRRYLQRNDIHVPRGPRKGVVRGPYKTGQPPRVCPCGGLIDRGSNSKFCSAECSSTYSMSGKTYGSRRTSVCLGCAEEFSRPSSHASKMMYCSNACAKREQKKGWGKTGVATPEGVLILRSMYELRFVACCERYGIDWRSYDGPEIKTSIENYRPDFVITLDGIERVVEVKGWVDSLVEIKLRESFEQGLDIVLVDQKLLRQLEQDKSQFFRL